MCLAASFWNLLTQPPSPRDNKVLTYFRKPHLILILLCLGILLEVDGFRTRRSEAAVDMARFLNAQKASAVAVEQIWKTGGRIYMPDVPRIDDISPEFISDKKYVNDKILDPQIEFVALQKRHIKRYGYPEMMTENGYQEILFPTTNARNEYSLFQRLNKSPK